MEHLGKADINGEIRRLRALQNQTRDEVKRSEFNIQIESLISQRNSLITNTHKHAVTRERMEKAAVTFDATHRARADID